MLKQREIRRSMTVMVNKEYVGKEAECALDGSEVGTKGNGIYIELIWSLNERNFIKQHVLLDVQTQKVVSFSITPEAHGDAKVMPATTRGTLKMDVGLTRILADGAYDTVSNWVLTEEIDLDVAFVSTFLPGVDSSLTSNFSFRPKCHQFVFSTTPIPY